MSIYDEYIGYLNDLDINNLHNNDFKSNSIYNGVLEHVSFDLGVKYANLIENEYSINYEDILGFVEINDRYGKPNKEKFLYKNKIISSSPTTLRYIYQALLILDHYKETACENMVEVGCGYGGLMLAINYFSQKNGIVVKNYHIVDLPEVCRLIHKYSSLNSENIHTNLSFHENDTYGKNIKDNNLFFISNYCYTEVNKTHNAQYSSVLISKTNNGFIVWQNGGNHGAYPISQANDILNKTTTNIIEEKPQTDSGVGICKNYFVCY
jgi:hypothetical protein